METETATANTTVTMWVIMHNSWCEKATGKCSVDKHGYNWFHAETVGDNEAPDYKRVFMPDYDAFATERECLERIVSDLTFRLAVAERRLKELDPQHPV